MARPQGSRNVLVRVTFDTIGELAGGIRGDTARRYAQRRLYDPRDLDSLLSWVNRRRAARGLALIGLPDGDNPAVSDDTAANDTPDDPWGRFLAGFSVYVPTLGQYRSLYDR